MKHHPIIKIFTHLFLGILVLNISLVIPKTEWMCGCDMDLERVSCSCNCPKCVDKRGGLLSYCRLSDSNDRDDVNVVSIRKKGCSCGLTDIVLNLPGNAPFITPQGADMSLFFPAYFLKTESPTLLLCDFVALPNHPG